MRFWLILFCLILVLNNGIMEVPKFVFDYIPVGHSAVLITWKSKPSISKDHLNRYRTDSLIFKMYRATANYTRSSSDNSETEGVDYLYTTYSILSAEQVLKHGLLPNTLYEVSIRLQFTDPANPSEGEIILPPLMVKTNRRTNTTTKPAKPDFRYDFSTRRFAYHIYLKIYWLPCGRERNCHGNEAGTRFAIKFRPIDRRGEDYRFESDHGSAYIDFICLIGGIQYEVIIISINGEYQTESDPQEIFVSLLSSAVTSVEVISFINGSVSVSWKPPKYALETLSGYIIGIINDSGVNFNPTPLLQHDSKLHNSDSTKNIYQNFSIKETEKFFDKQKHQLKPGHTYTFFILPFGIRYAGLETRVKYTIPRNRDDL